MFFTHQIGANTFGSLDSLFYWSIFLGNKFNWNEIFKLVYYLLLFITNVAQSKWPINLPTMAVRSMESWCILIASLLTNEDSDAPIYARYYRVLQIIVGPAIAIVTMNNLRDIMKLSLQMEEKMLSIWWRPR